MNSHYTLLTELFEEMKFYNIENTVEKTTTYSMEKELDSALKRYFELLPPYREVKYNWSHPYNYVRVFIEKLKKKGGSNIKEINIRFDR